MKNLVYILLLISFPLTLNAAIRYVSKTGSVTPPYTSWETASDSIQKCIDYSEFGDTIYVGPGVYEEQIVINPGIALIGSGWDKCTIKTRFEVHGKYTVRMKDNTILKGFNIEASRDRPNYQYSYYSHCVIINTEGGGGLIEGNRMSKCVYGIFVGQGSPVVKNNIIYDFSAFGITIESPQMYFKAVVENNFIVLSGYATACIQAFFGHKPTVINNLLIVDAYLGVAYAPGITDTLTFRNNMIISKHKDAFYAYSGAYDTYSIIKNNDIAGDFDYGIWDFNEITNNSITGNSEGTAIITDNTGNVSYNNTWNNKKNFDGIIPDSTNISYDPMYVDTAEYDLRLQMYSRLIDAGDPGIKDVDGSRSDIGAYGGPLGEMYMYEDLPPRYPIVSKVDINHTKIKIEWLKNTESDFKEYNVYGSRINGFEPSPLNLLKTTDTPFFYDKINEDPYYFKITAIDSQGNESASSEQVVMSSSAVEEGKELFVTDYRLWQNYPNPFNPSTKIVFSVKEASLVNITVYSLTGEKIEEITKGEYSPGVYEVKFNPEKDLASGIYIYKMDVFSKGIPVYTDIKKMIKLK